MMCDGSFHLFNTYEVKDRLKWLIMRNDRHRALP